jgi:peptide/nickel transport system substrate-binding protein
MGTSGAALGAAVLAQGGTGAAPAAPIEGEHLAQDGGREYHAAWGWLTLDSGGHFNSFIADAILAPPVRYGDLILAPLGLYYWESGEWLSLLASEWSFIARPDGTGATPATDNSDRNYFEVKLVEGATWSDGAAFTAADLEATVWCFRIVQNTLWSYIDSVDVIDDHTVHFHMSTPSSVVERYVIRGCNPRPASVFGPWAEEARALFAEGKDMDSPEGRQLLDRFSQFHPESVPATGPYMFDIPSISNATMYLQKNEQSYFAENVKFDRILNYNGETDTISPLVLNKDIDYSGNAFAPATEQEMISLGIRILRPPTYSGPAIYINFDKLGPAFENKLARHALAHILDRSQIGFFALADSGVGVEYMAGMSDNLVRRWIPEDVVPALNTYTNDTEQASALLMEAGWTKDGDAWHTPDGERASFELSFPAEFADWSAAALAATDQLVAFGIEIEPRAITYTQQPLDVDKGNFELAVQGWGSSSNPHPHFSYTQALFLHNTLAVNNGGAGMAFPLVQQTDALGEVDLETLIIESAAGLDEDLQKDRVTTIATAFNELLPVVPLFERFGNNAALEGVRVQAWPADDDPLLQNSFYADGIPTILIYTGLLDPV